MPSVLAGVQRSAPPAMNPAPSRFWQNPESTFQATEYQRSLVFGALSPTLPHIHTPAPFSRGRNLRNVRLERELGLGQILERSLQPGQLRRVVLVGSHRALQQNRGELVVKHGLP